MQRNGLPLRLHQLTIPPSISLRIRRAVKARAVQRLMNVSNHVEHPAEGHGSLSSLLLPKLLDLLRQGGQDRLPLGLKVLLVELVAFAWFDEWDVDKMPFPVVILFGDLRFLAVFGSHRIRPGSGLQEDPLLLR